jgi:hypothetical protein
MPIFYECDRCTACCRWPGQVKVTDEEVGRIAAFLELSLDAFRDRYMRLNASRTGLVLEDREDGACIFLEGDGCRIQGVKPQQCRDFPNLWNFPDFEKECRAKAVVVSSEEWRKRVLGATGRDAVPPA